MAIRFLKVAGGYNIFKGRRLLAVLRSRPNGRWTMGADGIENISALYSDDTTIAEIKKLLEKLS